MSACLFDGEGMLEDERDGEVEHGTVWRDGCGEVRSL
jgi:hypothetical protein